jgi:hypothetical protein
MTFLCDVLGCDPNQFKDPNTGRLNRREIHKAYNDWQNSELYDKMKAQMAEIKAQRAEIGHLKKIVSEKEGGIK